MTPDDFAFGVGSLAAYPGLDLLTRPGTQPGTQPETKPEAPPLRDPARELDILRRSGLFDAVFYLRTNPDIENSGVEPLTHYHLYGWAEGRRPNFYFDPAFYTPLTPESENPWAR